MQNHLLVVEEVAALLRVDKQRVYELIRTNRIPVIRLGVRQYRFSQEEINRWLVSGGAAAQAEKGKQEGLKSEGGK